MCTALAKVKSFYTLEPEFCRNLHNTSRVCGCDYPKGARIDAPANTLRLKLSMIENVESLESELQHLRLRELGIFQQA